MPSEASQRTAYRRVFSAMAGRPVVVRIADLGGDRAVPYVGWPREANPALGLRGLRLARWDASLHLAQLRAIGRAAADAAAVPRILAPMVATYDDARFFRELVADAWGGLRAASGTRPERVLLGAMVEIPAAALIADHLAGEVDFLSIGTNDLAQYALAADRGVAALAALQDALDPAVLRLVRMAVEAGKAAGIPVGACGALAGDPDGALVLAGLGVDSLSAEPAALGGVRAALAAARIGDLRGLADEAAPGADGGRGPDAGRGGPRGRLRSGPRRADVEDARERVAAAGGYGGARPGGPGRARDRVGPGPRGPRQRWVSPGRP